MTPLLISLSIFTSYVLYIRIRFGVQKSISDSYYRLNRSHQILFTLFAWGMSFPLLFVAMPITPLFFPAITGFMFVGAAAQFKDSKMTHNVHMIGAFGGSIFAYIAMFSKAFDPDNPIYLALCVVGLINIISIELSAIKNKIWYQEIVLYFVVWLYLLFKIILNY